MLEAIVYGVNKEVFASLQICFTLLLLMCLITCGERFGGRKKVRIWTLVGLDGKFAGLLLDAPQ